jgi:hypothetical protein
MSQFAWADVPHQTAYAVRFLFALLVVACFALFLKLWIRRHALSVRPNARKGEEVFPELRQLGLEDLLDAVDAAAIPFDELTVRDAELLASHLTEPTSLRRRVIEDVEIRKQQTVHNIRISWQPGSCVVLGERDFVPVMRLDKRDVPRELDVAEGRVLSSFETLALLLTACERLTQVRNGLDAQAVRRVRREVLSVIVHRPGFPPGRTAN